MADREKAITELESIQKSFDEGYGVALTHKSELVRDILELLKEQEAVEPRKQSDLVPFPWTSWWYVCGECGKEIDYHDGFCRHCGRQVKWE